MTQVEKTVNGEVFALVWVQKGCINEEIGYVDAGEGGWGYYDINSVCANCIYFKVVCKKDWKDYQPVPVECPKLKEQKALE